jgi:hemerythrin
MPIVTWTEAYSVKIKSIDDQHKKLFELINKLHEAMSAGKARQVLSEIFTELTEYTVKHFAYEEGLMAKYGYPGYLAHKPQHEKLTAQVQDLQRRHQQGELALSLEVSNFLKDWLTEHILKTDQKYSAFLKDKAA